MCIYCLSVGLSLWLILIYSLLFPVHSLTGHTGFAAIHQPNDGGRLKFPPLAAGALCTPTSLLTFLCHLAYAYENPSGSGGISHGTAVAMLGDDALIDRGAVNFMRAKVGLGVFVAQAGDNKVMLHQVGRNAKDGVIQPLLSLLYTALLRRLMAVDMMPGCQRWV